MGRLSQNTDSYNNVTTYEYDPVGNTTKTTNARQNDTANAYDALNRVTQVTDAHGGVVQYAYDSQDNLTSVTDALGLITTYSYDGFGNLASLTSPDTGITTYSYDNAGNRLTKTDARGVTTSYSYDAIGRLVSIDNPGNNLDVTFGYDAGTNGIGRLTSMIDGEGTTTYTYSTFGQLSNKSRTGDSNTATTFQYDYDTSGRLASLIYPSGRKVLYSYNTRGEVESLTVEYSDNTTTPLITNITRLPFGAIDTFDYGNGLTLSRTYDQNYRLIDQTIPLVVVNDYQYDPVGNISSLLDQLNSIRDQQFSYDELDRLTDASGPYGVLSYDYDANGNRTSYTDGSGIMYYSYDTTSHNLEQITGTITENRTYDAAGNTTSTADGTFEYDSTNRLFRFTSATLQGDYYYNGWGERIKKTVYGQTTRFRYGENAQLLGEYNGAGSVVREYVYLEGQPVAMLAGSADPKTVYYLHSDHLGAVAKATDSSQAIVWDADRKPFGALTLLSNQIEMPLRFPGQYYDYESGTYYNYFRTYDPSTGRYLESDPIGLSGGLNTYAYVGGNPVNGIDPLGLKELCEWITMYIEYIRNTNIPSRPIGLQTYDLDIRFEHSVTASGGLPNVRKGGRNFPVMPDITPPKAVWVPNTREWESFWEPEEYGYYECYDECGNEIPTDKMPGRKPDSRNGPSDRMDGVWSTFRPPTIQY
ncbi:MAG: RHS repeat-associated core domain-containing protein [Candidatus Sedimenticola sp. 20ELBAFRAG]